MTATGAAANTLPLQRYGTVEVTDQDQALEYCRRFFPLVNAFSFIGDGAPLLASADAWLADIPVSSVQTTGHRIAVGDHRWVTLLVPLRRSIAVSMGPTRLTGAGGGLLAVATGERVTDVDAGYVGGIIRLPAARVATHIEQLLQSDGPSPLEDVSVAHASDSVSSLLQFATYVMNDLDGPGTLAAHPYAQETAATLLVELTSLALLDQRASETGIRQDVPASEAQVRQAEAYMEANLDEPISIADIAADVGVSARALQLAFRRHRAKTPTQTLRDFRLERTHSRLSSANDASSVTQVAFECGFAHLGRFANAYLERYGERPSETRNRVMRSAIDGFVPGSRRH